MVSMFGIKSKIWYKKRICRIDLSAKLYIDLSKRCSWQNRELKLLNSKMRLTKRSIV